MELTSFTSQYGSSRTIDKPTGVVANNVLIMAVLGYYVGSAGSTTCVCATFTLVNTHGSGTEFNFYFYWGWKKASASEPSSYSYTNSGFTVKGSFVLNLPSVAEVGGASFSVSESSTIALSISHGVGESGLLMAIGLDYYAGSITLPIASNVLTTSDAHPLVAGVESPGTPAQTLFIAGFGGNPPHAYMVVPILKSSTPNFFPLLGA